MNIQMEEMCRARYVGRGTGLPQPGWAHHSPRMSMCSPIWKLSEPHTVEIFMETSSCSLINSISAPLPYLENERGGESLKIPSF